MSDPAVIDAPVVMVKSSDKGALPMFSGAQMATALIAYKELQRELDKAMPDQIMDLEGKAFRKKGYWRAVRKAFGLNVRVISERREVAGKFEDGRENFGYVVSCEAVDPYGQVAPGDGSCYAVEKARRFKCPHLQEGSRTRTVHWPHDTCPDFDPDYSWRTQPAQATEHNIRSHAHTRAFNRAVSNLVGFGEVSAEEVEDDPQHTEPATPTRQRTASAAGDTVTTVKQVIDRDGKKPHQIIFADGRKGGTFDDKLAMAAKDAMETKPPQKVKPTLETKGQFTDLTGLRVVESIPEPKDDKNPPSVPPELEQPIVETILTTRQVGNGNDIVTVIQGSEREYLSKSDDIITAANDFKKEKTKVVVKYEWVKGRSGRYVRNVTAFTDPPDAPQE